MGPERQTELTIYVDGHEQATRLKSELRACGLLVHPSKLSVR
jgi:hypothetical protein